MSEPTTKKLRLSDVYKKQAKAVAARRRVKAKKEKAAVAQPAALAAESADELDGISEVTAKVGKKAATKAKSSSKTKGKAVAAGEKRRLRADELPWQTVNTSTLPGMDGGGGMMMLEELDGVGVEWIEDEAGHKTARFTTSAKVTKEESEAEDEEESEAEGIEEGDKDGEEKEESEENDEDESEDEALPTFAGMDASDLDEADDEPVVEAEPYFDDRKLPAWKDVPIHATIKRGMLALQFKTPTEIQKRAVPFAMEGRDVVGVAETGSGKTLAYSLPILSHLLRQPAPRAGVRRALSALVLCPTRELAIQVNDHLLKVVAAALPPDDNSKKATKVPRISIGTVVGGLSAHKQKRILDRGCDILVATPGRLWDLLKMDDTLAADVRALRFLVIDEADRMIETGHFAELENIVGLTQRQLAPPTEDDDDPVFAQAATKLTETAAREDMQTFVFSATLSKDLQVNLKKKRRNNRKGHKSSTLEDLVDRLDFRDESPAIIDLSPEGGLVATLREAMVECVVADKDLYLYYFLLRYPGRSLVFTSSIDGIRRLIPLFETLNVPVWPLHSQLQQKQRLKNLERFKSATNGVLIATDVAARGLDIPHVDHVIHFNLPRTADNYVHRSGRTARAQNPGFALQIVSPEDRAVQRALLKSLGRDAPPPDLEIEGGFLPKLKERIAVARDIEKAQHNVKKENHDRNWLKEAAEAMDIDIDPDMFSDEEHDPDLPYARKQGPAASRAKNAAKVPQLKAKLATLLAQPLLARGVSAKYPTSGSRVIVHDLVTGAAHSNMLGADVGAAYEMIDLQKQKRGLKRARDEDKDAATSQKKEQSVKKGGKSGGQQGGAKGGKEPQGKPNGKGNNKRRK